MIREPFVRKKKYIRRTLNHLNGNMVVIIGEIINDAWVYYDYFGEDENPEKNRFEENTQKFSWSLIDEKYNEYQVLF